ncbi:hypothetical protein LX32DRAFT_453082 [Colletotrichum zoysiae]|uniref:Uncharacterized protein n=1 Tax=Colletotrichum zoysiae TaxID=1216348 RepID=A0AAD9HE16_9PEZI|nr:hypothetical protein LX32DRAFT_453082 [Colletotrichum zoysiae]
MYTNTLEYLLRQASTQRPSRTAWSRLARSCRSSLSRPLNNHQPTLTCLTPTYLPTYLPTSRIISPPITLALAGLRSRAIILHREPPKPEPPISRNFLLGQSDKTIERDPADCCCCSCCCTSARNRIGAREHPLHVSHVHARPHWLNFLNPFQTYCGNPITFAPGTTIHPQPLKPWNPSRAKP